MDRIKRANQESTAQIARPDTLTPADRYQELFEAVQMKQVFKDRKSFVDAVPKEDPDDILNAYRAHCDEPGFDLKHFVDEHFDIPKPNTNHYVSPPQQSMADHIDTLWGVLTRHPKQHPPNSSILPLPDNYVVPGGRFAELYYWDSYFVMLGLAASGRQDLLKAMANNFAYLIDTYGHIPNGNRSYYLSRSQPPVFALMVEMFEKHDVCRAIEYLPRLRLEYAYWMSGSDDLRPGEARRSSVRLEDGSLLNRYWDDRDSPREESYREDVDTAKKSSRPVHETYRDLRAGAASGWDFSSRWCDGPALHTIRTTAILPVDLNCFLYKLEAQIALLSRAGGQAPQADAFERKARARRAAIEKVFWHESLGAYLDFDFQRDAPRVDALNAATVTPLFIGLSSPVQARRVGEVLRQRLLDQGGLATTLCDSGQQWDQPNGWAPLQWIAIEGLRRYDDPLAGEIAHRWLHTVGSVYQRQSKLVEKYVVRHHPDGAMGGGGGEYPLQDGFGWTNGVARQLMKIMPAHKVHRARAACTD